ncbi:DinB family protein [Amycolatopsis thermalba]|uniref:DinB family protein n=1 Tax=Amycolatopsis thermalba TaxID=944492 RepID=A0ABY4P208_9PSEU|nr:MULTISPECIES: DinB family protein [Amycolatopsis]UQS26339.1 DinB family protein [Amycolatopsis thermalba]
MDIADTDLTGSTFRTCDLSGLKIADSRLYDVSISGDLARFVVNDVDVTDFVEAELDRRHPERVQLRTMETPADFRAMWGTIESLWADTLARARRLPGELLHERVDGEWSFVETLRHLVFATDAWVSRTILDQPMPYHRLALPQTSYPDPETLLGVDVGARPALDEVLEVRADRMGLVRRIVDGLTDGELSRPCRRSPAPGYPAEPHPVGKCLRVVMNEECEHRRYAVRDLAALEARTSGR